MSEQPPISTTHFSRILIDLGPYIQRINLNRIIDEFEAKNFLSSATVQKVKGIPDEFEKSNIVIGIMQGKQKEKDFKTFLKIIAAEKPDSKFYDATREFFSGFWQFPGYDEYATWPDGESVMHFGYSIAKGSLMFHQGCNASFAPPTPMWAMWENMRGAALRLKSLWDKFCSLITSVSPPTNVGFKVVSNVLIHEVKWFR